VAEKVVEHIVMVFQEVQEVEVDTFLIIQEEQETVLQLVHHKEIQEDQDYKYHQHQVLMQEEAEELQLQEETQLQQVEDQEEQV
jgi:hypothetical protein